MVAEGLKLWGLRGDKESGRRKKLSSRGVANMTKEQVTQEIRLTVTPLVRGDIDGSIRAIGRLIVKLRKAVRQGSLKHQFVYWVLEDLHRAQRMLSRGDTEGALLNIRSALIWWKRFGE